MNMYLEPSGNEGSMGQALEFKLANGHRLIVHDVDLEDDGQVWYEEAT